MKLKKTNWDQLLSKLEDAWFYVCHPALLFMRLERIEERQDLNEDIIDYDLGA